MNEVFWITHEKKVWLEKRLVKLKAEDFINNREAMRAAKSGGGGIHDNAGYDNALMNERLILSKITEIENVLNKSQIIPKISNPKHITIGCKVVVFDRKNKERRQIVISGYGDTDVKRGKYSYLSPFAQSFILKKVGDIVTYIMPETQETTFEILEISPANEDNDGGKENG